MGIAILPSLVGNTSKAIQPLSPASSIITSPIWILTQPDLAKSMRIRAVTGFLTGVLRDALEKRDLTWKQVLLPLTPCERNERCCDSILEDGESGFQHHKLRD